MADCANDVTVLQPEVHDIEVSTTENTVGVVQPAVQDVGVVQPAQHPVSVQQPQVHEVTISIPGAVDQARCVKVDFTHNTASPLFVALQASDELVVESWVVIESAFDGTAPALTLGSAGNPGLIFATNDVRPANTDQFHNPCLFTATSPTTLQLFITPGAGHSTGSGYVFLLLKRP